MVSEMRKKQEQDTKKAIFFYVYHSLSLYVSSKHLDGLKHKGQLAFRRLRDFNVIPNNRGQAI